jgi:hypothetical protein
VHAAREQPGAGEEGDHEQEVEGDHAVGQDDRLGSLVGDLLDGPEDRDGADEDDRRDDDGPDERLVVALTGVAPASLVDARDGEDERRAEDHPGPRAVVEQAVGALRAAVEAQLEREEVCECDQCPVHAELRQRVAMQREGRRAKPSAHPRHSTPPGGGARSRSAARRLATARDI